MSKFLLIAKREYLSQVRKKTFLLLTLLAPFLLLVFTLFLTFIFQSNESKVKLTVVNSNSSQIKFENTDFLEVEYIKEDAKNKLISKLIQSETSQALLIIPNEKVLVKLNDKNSLQLYTNHAVPRSVHYEIKQQVAEYIKKLRLKNLGIDVKQYEEIQPNIILNELNIKSSEHLEEADQMVKQIFSYVLMYVTFMFTIIYGTRVMRNILEEKNNRVVEIIISSVKPIELMLGKILGTTFVALTQFIIWIVMTLILLKLIDVGIASHTSNLITSNYLQSIPLEEISKITASLWKLNYSFIIFVFLFYFFFGYLFYSSFFAAIGSAVDSETETSQFTPLLILPLTLSVYASISVINNPSGDVSYWLSIFPVTSPIIMNSRVSFGIPTSELLISMLILILSTIGMMYLASKIYRTGILMYGKKTTYKEIFKWIKYK